jgi:hypothetical protein
METEAGDHSLWRRMIVATGRPWVFWPAFLFAGVLNHGPDGRSTSTWLVILVAVGPLLASVIYALCHRQPAVTLGGSGRSRMREHFRGRYQPHDP